AEAPRQLPQLPLPARPSADLARRNLACVARVPPPASPLPEQHQFRPQSERPQCPRPEARAPPPRGSLRRAPGAQAHRRARSPTAPSRQKPPADPHPDALARARVAPVKLGPAKHAPAEPPAGGHTRFWVLQSWLPSPASFAGTFPSGNGFAPESCVKRERKFNRRSRTSVSSASVAWAWLIPCIRSPARMRFRSPVASRSSRRLTLD